MEIKLIKGLIAPILTPFDNELKLDQKMYNDLAKDLMENGCSGLAPFGTTGEALSVSNKERMLAIEGLVKSGIDPKTLIPGTGLCNLPDTIEITKHAVDLGCLGAMTLPPFYFKGMSDEGLYEYFEKLIHRFLKKHRVGKEYFKINLSVAKNILKKISKLSKKGEIKLNLMDLSNNIDL